MKNQHICSQNAAAGWLAAWLPGCLAAWLLAAWLPGCSAAWLLGCLAAWLPGCLAAAAAAPAAAAAVCKYLLTRASATKPWLTKHYLPGLPVFARQGIGHQTIADEALFASICSPGPWPPNHGWRSTICQDLLGFT